MVDGPKHDLLQPFMMAKDQPAPADEKIGDVAIKFSAAGSLLVPTVFIDASALAKMPKTEQYKLMRELALNLADKSGSGNFGVTQGQFVIKGDRSTKPTSTRLVVLQLDGPAAASEDACAKAISGCMKIEQHAYLIMQPFLTALKSEVRVYYKLDRAAKKYDLFRIVCKKNTAAWVNGLMSQTSSEVVRTTRHRGARKRRTRAGSIVMRCS